MSDRATVEILRAAATTQWGLAMTDNISLAVQMDVNPDDLDENGVLKPYRAPEFPPYPTDELETCDEQPSNGDAPPDEEFLSSPRIGWCPSGSVSDGICSPFNNIRTDWMGRYATSNLRVDELILPGTHNAGMDKQASYSNSYDTCQDVSPHSQLQTGIRALDLRVQFFSGYPQGDRRRFAIFHSSNSGRNIEGDVLQAVINLYTAHRNEVVILDFHDFKNFTVAAHRELATVIKNRLGSKLIEPKWKTLVLRQLWALQKTVVIAYNDEQRDPLFWPGVNQRWIGKDRPSSSELKSFIDRVGNETKPDYQLRAIQAHKYTLVYQPDDMSPDVMNWFAAGENNSPIMKFFIINTDWSLRHRFVDNCIYANSLRNRKRASVHWTPNNIPGGMMDDYYHAIVVETSNGNWSSSLFAPSNPPDAATMLIICRAQLQTLLHTSNSDFPNGIITLAQNNVVLFQYTQKKWVLQNTRTYTPNSSGNTVPAPLADEKLIKYQTGDGNWTEHISLPTSAPTYSYVEISSSAGYYSQIHRQSGRRVYRCQRGDKYLFMFNQGVWQPVKPAIHSYGAAQAGAQMADTGTEQTRVHFKDGDWIAQITLPANAWQGDTVTLTSNATYTATVMGTNLESGASVQLRRGDTLHYRYVASIGKWRSWQGLDNE